jgi:hypothetical protein
VSPPTAFYCVSSPEYFLGAVAMINSLRLHGHREPVYLLDAGLSAEQRELVATEATIVPAPSAAEPFMLKTVAPLAHPAEVMVLIDVDMIVTRHLGELVERARGGGVVAFENDVDRFVPEWGELPGARGLHRHRYVSSGFVALGGDPGLDALRAIVGAQGEVDFERTQFRVDYPEYPYTRGRSGSEHPDYPYFFADQDLLNAVLATRLAPERVRALPARLAPIPPFGGIEVLDERTLRCAYADGAEPYVLHHFLAKPWLEPTHHGVYSRLLRRLLIGSDVAISVPAASLPRRLRRGLLAYADRTRVNLRERLRYHVVEPAAVRLGRAPARGGKPS